nr:PREDICTED: hyaluronidase-1-like [Latimeria chalumnae]|eukprot:XP_005992714.1 PREDICTED: hyaluronidase-1-like [Latimeria chalumnae]
MLSESTLMVCPVFWISILQSFAGGILVKPAAFPVVHRKPFIVVWNMAAEKCHWAFGIDFPLKTFGIIANRDGRFHGQNMTIFYKKTFGEYPYISAKGEQVNGGIPQKGNLNEHLEKSAYTFEKLLHRDFDGLAVVDWEEWRPLWARNWGPKRIYQELSKDLVISKYPFLPNRRVNHLAKEEFEGSAQDFMRETLRLGREVRPLGLWGFYKFPDCYNYNWKNSDNYTGHCNPNDIPRNDRLTWLWKESTALYPSIYLQMRLGSSEKAVKFVRYKIKEALRVAEFGSDKSSLPVLAYVRIAFVHSFKYLSEIDLVHTIGESASLGAAGVVIWGDSLFGKTYNRCESIQDYLNDVLGKYIVNITMATQICSRHLCSGNGRCRRRDMEKSAFLHLNPENFKLSPFPSGKGTQLNVMGQEGKEDIQNMKRHFVCHCYSGWDGLQCQNRKDYS